MEPRGYPADAAVDYRGSARGPMDARLPLPRRSLPLFTALVVVTGFAALQLPFVTVGWQLGSSSGIRRIIREGGSVSYVVVALHVALALALTTLGIFIARGRRIPGLLATGSAFAPLIASILGSFLQRSQFVKAITGINPSMVLRIGAAGLSETDALLIFGSLSSACLCLIVGVSTFGAVLAVDGTRISGVPGGASRHAPLIASGLAAIALLSALVGPRVLVGTTWRQGPTPKLAVLLTVMTGVAAGLVLVALRRLGPVWARSEPSTATVAVASSVELRRVHGLSLVCLLTLIGAVFLVDRAALLFIDREVLMAIATSVPPDLYALDEAARAIVPAKTNAILDGVVAVVMSAPAIAQALRRRTLMHFGSLGAVAVAAILVLLSHRARETTAGDLASAAERRAIEMPTDLIVIPEKNAMSSRGAINFVITASDEVREVDPTFSSSEVFIAAAAESSFAAILDVASRNRSPTSPSKRGKDIERVHLVGKSNDVRFPDSLRAYQAFLAPPLRERVADLSLAPPRVEEQGADQPSSDSVPPSAFPRSAIEPLYVFATSPQRAIVSCVTARETLRSEISLMDPAQADTEVRALRSRCRVGQTFIVPSANARATEVYRLVGMFTPMTSGLVLTADRVTAKEWLDRHPPGQHPSEVGRSARGIILQGSPTVLSGRLTEDAISAVIRREVARFRRCYDTGLLQSPQLAGKVTVEMVIDRDGLVSRASMVNPTDLPDSATVDCVVSAFSALAFPAPAGGAAIVRDPLVFTPRSRAL